MWGIRPILFSLGMALAAAPMARAADTYPFVHILDAQSQAIRDALRENSPLAGFYEYRNYQPFWIADEARIAELLDTLEHGGEHGLPVAVYDPAGLRALYADAASPAMLADAELAMSRAFVTYAQHVNSGVLIPREVDREIGHRPERRAPQALLAGVERAASVADFAATLTPQTANYQRLLEEKKRLEAIIASDGWGPKVPSNRTLRPGTRSDRILALRARLERMGFGHLGDSREYDEQLVMTIKLAQSRYGLNTDGVAGPGTLGAINMSAEERLQQVLVNLERQRWVKRAKIGRRIDVNLADATVTVVDDDRPTFVSRTVIGRNQHELRTPEFSHTMTHMIVNPFWHVPKSIAQKEYLPMLQQDPMALAKRGLWLLNRRGQRLNTEGADFSVYSEGNFPFAIKQPPGGGNALGRVKFMFPNKNNIYLHDTPAKSLFFKDRRAYSHGCVRVQRPFDLAYHLLAPQSDDPEGEFHAALKRGREKQIDLETPVPIHLSYDSVWIGDDGVPQYRADVYKRDRRVFKALQNAGVRVQALEG